MSCNKVIESWDIKPADIECKECSDKFQHMYRKAKSQQEQRTKGHSFFTKVSHMQSLYDPKEGQFSEGSTQAIKRKLRSETIQRVPDGELKTPFDKNSIEQVELDFIFKNKILTSEYDGKDMMKNLWRTFNSAYDYGYGCVRTGFEKDLDGDYRVSYKLIQWNDILPAPDCDYIEEAQWYMVREYISRSELKALIDWDTDTLKDNTYEELTVKYLIKNGVVDGPDPRSIPMADRKHGVTKTESIEIWTLYKRGSDVFKTFVPACNALLRVTKNHDPRKDVPLHFMILEPDPEFPLGMSSIIPTLSHQQFADAFQTSAYKQLLLSVEPPLMGFGNLTNAKIKMRPRAYWNMGTNPNNKIEKFPVETTTLTQYNAIMQNTQGNMMKNMNVTEQTVASDAHVMTYSGTPQGVEQQRRDRTTTVNQYQKGVETVFAEWANHALRSYLSAVGGKQELTVDEETRRKIWDVESSMSEKDPETGEPLVKSIINGNKIEVDFSRLKEGLGLLEFTVRAGSLVQSEREKEREDIQSLIVPISQMIPAVDEENKKAFTDVIMQLVARMCELSEVDISQSTADKFNEQLIMQAILEQQNQINMLAQNQQAMLQQPEQQPNGMPAEAGMPVEPMAPDMGGQAMPPEVSAEFPEAAGETTDSLV